MQIISCVYYFFVSVVLVKTRCEVINDVNNSFIKLLELQMDYCSELSLCTIKSRRNTSLNQLPATCCKTCSCNVDCLELGNCCPDIQIADVIGDNVLGNISELSERLQDLNSTYKQRLQKLGVAPLGESFDAERNLDCVKTKAYKTDFRLETARLPHSYLMITSCPEALHSSMDIASKCTYDVPVEPFSRNKLEPDLVVPVTSRKTNITYKNIYCFRCNEDGQVEKDWSYWKMIFTCSLTYGVIGYNNPYVLFQRITPSDTIYNCNIQYQPRNTVEQLVNRCSAVDVKTCPANTDKEVDNICRTYYSPVIDQTSYETYKNIACYLCNKKRIFKTYCGSINPYSIEFSMELNFLMNDDNTLLRYNLSQMHVINVSFANLDGDRCKTGFIINLESGSCRRVLCPRYFYPVSGSCIPAFTQIRNISFTVMFEVIRNQTLGMFEKDSFYQVYLDHVARVVAELSGQFTYGMWKMTNNNDVLVLSFTIEESTYVRMIYTLSNFLTQVSILNVKTKTKTVETITTMFNGDTQPLFISGKLYKPPKLGKRRVQLNAVRAYRALPKSVIDIRISRSHLCYRTELGPFEFYIDIKGILYINNNDTVLNRNDVEYLRKEGRIRICLEDLYKNLTDVQATYLVGGVTASVRTKVIKMKLTLKPKQSVTLKPKQSILSNPDDINFDTTSDFETETEVPKGLVLTMVFVTLIGVIGLVKFLKYRKERRARRET